MMPLTKRAAAAVALLLSGATAQESSTTTSPAPSACATLTPAYSPPVVAKGWKAQLIATGLTRPRGIKFDSNGGLLVIEQGVGLTHLTLDDNGGTCVSVAKNTTVIEDSRVGSIQTMIFFFSFKRLHVYNTGKADNPDLADRKRYVAQPWPRVVGGRQDPLRLVVRVRRPI